MPRPSRSSAADSIELFEKHARKLAGEPLGWADGFNDRPYEGDHARAIVAIDALVQTAHRTRDLVARVERAFASLDDVGDIMNARRRGKASWQEIVDVAVEWLDERLKTP